MVFTDTALLLDLGSPPQRPGSTFKATDINYLASIFAAYSKQTAPACTSGGCFAARTSSLPHAPSIPWGGYPPASLLLPFGGTSDWPNTGVSKHLLPKLRSKQSLNPNTGWVELPLPPSCPMVGCQHSAGWTPCSRGAPELVPQLSHAPKVQQAAGPHHGIQH